MIELKDKFIGKGQVKGFRFTQIKKTEYGFIYRIHDKGRIYYEVFERKENNRFNCVSYPSNKAFGVWAWTTTNFCRAEDILQDIEINKGASI
jgi:hypothetical protein